ncbi:GNAT family N-acetyltransferase [Pseudomonas sp. BW16M2]|uniref:GNAT family N-acetyltransferase n=1 Tax=Pseudomonas sp. BW16M2 TaxID=2745489 RepID=UPI00164603EC|nr:GNAT family N-acetyltransferase [Pseudomonas sp. BW16M2]MBC3437946.1 GNAT family N-acetyltransferase [Pseudomonas sp. BW16M2]
MLEIRRASRHDALQTYTIRRQAILHQCAGAYGDALAQAWADVPFTEGYAALVADHFHLACMDGTIAATGMLDLHSGELGALFVLPSFMGRGIARRMVEHLEGIARAEGLETVHLDATLNAAAFYRNCGYVGDALSTYQSPFGLELSCIPMRKAMARV